MSTPLSTGTFTEVARATEIFIQAANENPSFSVKYERRYIDDKTGEVLSNGIPLNPVSKNYSDIMAMSVDVPGLGKVSGPQLFAAMVAWADMLRTAP